MKKQYIFIFLLIILLYLLIQIALYKYNEFRVIKYMDEIILLNEQYENKIQDAQARIEKITTPAYINKSLKSQQGLKNPGEVVTTLISEDSYNTYTQNTGESIEDIQKQDVSPLTDESLIATMSIYQKWIYLLFGKDIR